MMTTEELNLKLSKILVRKRLTIGTCESCTAGRIASALTSLDGASRYFRGSILTYATELKTKLLGLPAEQIEKHDVVSSYVAKKMALAALSILETDIAIGITGYAGATGGTLVSPAGTVWIAAAFKGKDPCAKPKVYTKVLHLSGNRLENLTGAVNASLQLVLRYLL